MEKRNKHKMGEKSPAILQGEMNLFYFCAGVLYVNWYMGFFDWLRRPCPADTPCLPGCCYACWNSLKVSLNLTRVWPHWYSRPPWVLSRTSMYLAHMIQLFWATTDPGSAALSDSLPRKLKYSCSCSTEIKVSHGFLSCNQIEVLAAHKVFFFHSPQNRSGKKALALKILQGLYVLILCPFSSEAWPWNELERNRYHCLLVPVCLPCPRSSPRSKGPTLPFPSSN